MNGIILAAGMGTRLQPITNDRPKALVEINGKSLFSQQLELMENLGVSPITVVTGHAHRAFIPWNNKPGLNFLYNPHYHDRNNFYSLYLVREKLGNTLVIDGDLWIDPHALDNQSFHKSCWFLGNRNGPATEWFAQQDQEGRVQSISVRDGEGQSLTGVSYWNAQDGQCICSTLEHWYASRDTTPLYWDDVPRALLQELEIYGNLLQDGSWWEIDTPEDKEILEEKLKKSPTRSLLIE